MEDIPRSWRVNLIVETDGCRGLTTEIISAGDYDVDSAADAERVARQVVDGEVIEVIGSTRHA